MGEAEEKCKADFLRDGFVIMRQAVEPDQLEKLNADINAWVEESKSYAGPYGKTQDGRARFDVEPKTHNADKSALRRVAAPIEISDAFLDFVRDNAALDLTADIFGRSIKLYASKINLKLPGSGTVVKFHQDFPFDPHTNDDMMTVLFFLDDVTEDNGPLKIVPGSHHGPLLSHYQDGVFTGAVSAVEEERCIKEAVLCTGKAGDICLMHARSLHGSSPNLTESSRNLLIVTYVAEDAMALVANPIPHKYDGEVVRGVKTGTVRSVEFSLQLPEYPETASFFDQQAKTG